MQTSEIPSPAVHPLDSNGDLIRLIADVSGESDVTVIRRLLDEERCIGTNVRNDLRASNVKPHVWSDELIHFYRTTRSFLYETAVWNRAPLKLRMRNWMGRFLHRRAAGRRLQILSFGDGLGFDSVYLAKAGHEVTYYEVADECVAFAQRVFAGNGQDVRIVRDAASIPNDSFDVVLAMDVLEHVPSPPDCVKLFAGWLREGGWLLTHSPFFFTTWHRVTHLHSNRKYSGCEKLFERHGLHLVDGRFFWDPIALQKAESTPPQRNLFPARCGGVLLKLGRYVNAIHSPVAQFMAKTDVAWGNDLARRLASNRGDQLSDPERTF